MVQNLLWCALVLGALSLGIALKMRLSAGEPPRRIALDPSVPVALAIVVGVLPGVLRLERPAIGIAASVASILLSVLALVRLAQGIRSTHARV